MRLAARRCLRAVLFALWLGADAARAGPAAAQPLVVGLDHVPVAVRDLDVAAADYRRLGFTLKPGRIHEDGIRNFHAKFRDGTEIELITAPAAVDDTTRAYVQLQSQGEGAAYVGLYAPDADRLLAALARLSPRYRQAGMLVMRPEADPGSYLFFGPRNASPTDRPEHFVHANGADGLTGVWLAIPPGAAERGLLAGLGARVRTGRACVPDCAGATIADFAEGSVTFVPAGRELLPGRPVIGAELAVSDWAALQATLAGSGIVARMSRDASGARHAFVAPADAHGLWLEFSERAAHH